jgi:septum formation protein
MVTSSRPQFVLASASKGRRLLLLDAGIHPFVCPSNFDEDQVQVTAPPTYVATLARCKAEIVAPQFPTALVLGCDSVLAFQGQIYGKPENNDEALARWRIMRGHMGEIHTGHALIAPGGNTLIRSAVTRVYFSDIDDATLVAYVNTGEPLTCAGAFSSDGKGALMIDKIEGCHSNVIGLSLPLLRTMLEQLGYRATEFW